MFFKDFESKKCWPRESFDHRTMLIPENINPKKIMFSNLLTKNILTYKSFWPIKRFTPEKFDFCKIETPENFDPPTFLTCS